MDGHLEALATSGHSSSVGWLYDSEFDVVNLRPARWRKATHDWAASPRGFKENCADRGSSSNSAWGLGIIELCSIGMLELPCMRRQLRTESAIFPRF